MHQELQAACCVG